jgi:uncharacterized protein YyaL (SSP411 family)
MKCDAQASRRVKAEREKRCKPLKDWTKLTRAGGLILFGLSEAFDFIGPRAVNCVR